MTHDNVDCSARHIKNNGLCRGWQISLRQQRHDWLLQINTNEGPCMHVLSAWIAVIYHLPSQSVGHQSSPHPPDSYSDAEASIQCSSNFSTFLAPHLFTIVHFLLCFKRQIPTETFHLRHFNHFSNYKSQTHQHIQHREVRCRVHKKNMQE